MEMRRPALPKIITQNLRLHIIISTAVRIIIFLILARELYTKNWLFAFAAAMMLFVSFLPSIIAKKYKIFLPSEFDLLFSIFLFSSFILGEMRDYYIRYWWWDLMLHSIFAFMLGMAGFSILYSLYLTEKIKSSAFLASFFSFCFSLSLGALWEIIEFSIDYLLGTNMQKSGLVDTITDLMVDTLGALLASALGYLYIKKVKLFVFDAFIGRFIRIERKLR